MYLPYIRGKQFDLLALRETAELISSNNQIIPIIEPVKKNFASLHKSLTVFRDAGMPYILISNPMVGDLIGGSNVIGTYLEDENMDSTGHRPGYIISINTELASVENFIQSNQDKSVSLIHYQSFPEAGDLRDLISRFGNIEYNIFIEGYSGENYRNTFVDTKRVVIEDPFNQQKRNADFPSDEFFSELFHSYSLKNYDGFGDFLIVGDKYFDSGGPAYTVAIHMTYRRSDEELWIRHFLSESRLTDVDTPGKFLEALTLLCASIDAGDISGSLTPVIDEFRDLLDRQYYPGLGTLKKLSLIHHIQLMASILESEAT